MKRQILFSIMVVALAVVNTSCNDKEESIQPTFNHIITVNELMGYWQHQSTEYMGIVITNCDEVDNPNIPSEKQGLLIFDLNITPPEPGMEKYYDGLCDWVNVCKNFSNDNIELKQFDTENKISIGNTVFQVLEYNKNTKILKIKMMQEPNDNDSYSPFGAIYTLIKR